MISSGPLSGQDKGCAVRAGFRAFAGSRPGAISAGAENRVDKFGCAAVSDRGAVTQASACPLPAPSLPAPILRAGAANDSARIYCVVGHPPLQKWSGHEEEGENASAPSFFSSLPSSASCPQAWSAIWADACESTEQRAMQRLGRGSIWSLMTAFC
jgi:hypothetical protein